MNLPFIEPDYIIAFGKAACNIADGIAYSGLMLSDLPRSLYIDYEDHQSSVTIILKKSDSPEDYEKDYLINNIPPERDRVLAIIVGGTHTSSASLSILEKFKHCEIHILYIYPDEDLLNKQEFQSNRMIFSVLQEMTRSGVFQSFSIIENEKIEEFHGGLPLIGRYEKINETINSSLNLLFECGRLKAVENYLHRLPAATRINTVAIIDNLESFKFHQFYDISDITDIQFVFFINENKLKTEKKLQKTIKEKITKIKIDRGCRTSYAVYACDYKQDVIYAIMSTSNIQKINGEKNEFCR